MPAGESLTCPRSPLPDAKQGVRAAEASREAGLTDFLAPPQADDELGRLGRYRVLKVLGAGGMGVVFQAEDPTLQRLVALKAMLPALAASADARQRFLREARAAAAIEHDHIVRHLPGRRGPRRPLPGHAVPRRPSRSTSGSSRSRPLPLRGSAAHRPGDGRGLAAAHERGLIHRDIKPANLWLEGEPGGRVKILDFGLARAAPATTPSLTQQGAIVGTPAYMAPEQAAASRSMAALRPVQPRRACSIGCVPAGNAVPGQATRSPPWWPWRPRTRGPRGTATGSARRRCPTW